MRNMALPESVVEQRVDQRRLDTDAGRDIPVDIDLERLAGALLVACHIERDGRSRSFRKRIGAQ